MANLPKLMPSNDNNAKGSEDFVSDLGKAINKNFQKAFSTSAVIQTRMIDDTIKANADIVSVNQEQYNKALSDIKKDIVKNELEIKQPIQVELINLAPLTDRMDGLLNAFNKVGFSENTKPTEEETKEKKSPKKDNEADKDRSIFGKFFKLFQTQDNKSKMGKNKGGDDWIRKFSNFFALALNPTEYFSVAGRKIVGTIGGMITKPIIGLINGIIGFAITGIAGIAQVLVGSLFSGAMLKAGLGKLSSLLGRINPVVMILTGIATMVYDAIQGWFNTEGSNTDKAVGALKGAFLSGGIFKMTGKWAAFGAAVGSVVPVIGTLAGGIIGGIIGLVISIIGPDVIAGWISDAWSALKGFGATVYGYIEQAYQNVANFVSDIGQWFSDKYDHIVSYITEKKNQIYEWIESFREILVNALSPIADLFNNLSEWIGSISIDGIRDNLKSSIDWFKETFEWISGAITGWFDDKVKQLKNLKNRVLGIFGLGSDEVEDTEPVNTEQLMREAEEKQRRNAARIKAEIEEEYGVLDKNNTLINLSKSANDAMESIVNQEKSTFDVDSINTDRKLTPNEVTQYLEHEKINSESTPITAVVSDNRSQISSTNVVNSSNTHVSSVSSPIDINRKPALGF